MSRVSIQTDGELSSTEMSTKFAFYNPRTGRLNYAWFPKSTFVKRSNGLIEVESWFINKLKLI